MRRRVRGWRLAFIAVQAACTSAAAAYLYLGRPAGKQEPFAPSPASQSVASPLEIKEYCSKCHAYPPADSFPRSAWKEEVEKAYKLIAQSNLHMKRLDGKAPSMEQVINYYEERAPLELPMALIPRATHPLPLRFRRRAYPVVPQAPEPAVANVNLVHLFDERRLDLLACDMRAGLVMALRPYAPSPAWEVLGSAPNPCHAAAVD